MTKRLAKKLCAWRENLLEEEIYQDFKKTELRNKVFWIILDLPFY